MNHTFHIPVLGLAFSIDTPVKVARYGISSVVSIVDDILIERMRQFYAKKINEDFVPISSKVPDFRAKRITAYLNLLKKIVDKQFELLKNSEFSSGSEISKYFELLPDRSLLKKLYNEMVQISDVGTKEKAQNKLRKQLYCGSIDVNIMSKVDKMNFSSERDNLGDQFTDAIAALRGFAKSDLNSSDRKSVV